MQSPEKAKLVQFIFLALTGKSIFMRVNCKPQDIMQVSWIASTKALTIRKTRKLPLFPLSMDIPGSGYNTQNFFRHLECLKKCR